MPQYPAIRTVVEGITTTRIVTQYPYTETDEFPVVQIEMDCGKAYSLNYGTSTSIRGFIVRYSVLEPEEFGILEAFWIQMNGRLGTFSFQDDDGTVWPKCRFDMAEDSFGYTSLNQYSIEHRIRVLPH